MQTLITLVAAITLLYTFQSFTTGSKQGPPNTPSFVQALALSTPVNTKENRE